MIPNEAKVATAQTRATVLQLESKRQQCETLKRKLIGSDNSVGSWERKEAKEDSLVCGLGKLVNGATNGGTEHRLKIGFE